MSLADVLDPRDDDATTVAIYTAYRGGHAGRAAGPGRGVDRGAARAAGLRPGQAVGVMLPNGPDIVAALFGVWFAGGVYVPLNPRLSADELAHVIAEDRPAAIVTRPDDAARVVDVPVVTAPGDGTLGRARPGRRRRAGVAPGVAAISFTSGTTGRPKPVPLLHDNVLGLIDGVLGQAPRWRAGAASPPPGQQGADAEPDPDVAVAVGRDLQRDLRLPRRRAPSSSWTASTPARSPASSSGFQLRSTVLPPAAMTMLSDDESITSLAPLKYVRSITAPLSPLQARRFRDRFGITVLNGWGQTEIGGEIVGWSAAGRQGVRRRRTSARWVAPTRTSSCASRTHGEILVQTPMIVERAAAGDDMRRPPGRRLVPHRRPRARRRRRASSGSRAGCRT